MKNTNNTLTAIQLTQVIEQLKQDDSSLLQAYSEYSAENGYDSVYDNDDESINMMFENTHDALRSAFYGDYNPSHAYFTFNGYGNLQSFEYLDSDNSPIDVSELAQWLISEDRLADYDITVTTLDDMLASIEDNITDDSELLKKLTDYVDKSVFSQDALMLNKYNACDDFVIHEYMNMLGEYSYKELNNVINHLGINYQ